MFSRKKDFEPFENKVWLASPTMHDGAEMKYVKEAYDTNWMSTVGANINEVEKVAAEKSGVKYAVALSCCTAALHLCVKFAVKNFMVSRKLDMEQLREKEFSVVI